jgi:hypothetical protein
VIDWLHPVTLGVAVACVPIAAVAISGAIDLIAHRQHQARPGRIISDRSSSSQEDMPQSPASRGVPATPNL